MKKITNTAVHRPHIVGAETGDLCGSPHWQRVICAADCEACPDCGDPVCPVCEMHYADCECPGPTMEDYDYKEIKGVLYARARS